MKGHILLITALLATLPALADKGMTRECMRSVTKIGGGLVEMMRGDSVWNASDSTWMLIRKTETFQDDFEFRFAWGFTNWGDGPFSHYGKMTAGYSIRTSFSSYQLELAYYPVRGGHWCFGAGLGYESNIYRFNNSYVAISNPNGAGVRTFETASPLPYTDCKTRLVTRYVTIPLTVKWSPDGSFVMGLTLLPGINYTNGNTGMKYEMTVDGNEAKLQTSETAIINMFKCDARLSVGWQFVQIFYQISTTPLLCGMDRTCYPFKFGFMIEI